MSLNGLDSPDVQDAYQAAVAEAGGWFLLKYDSRDSVLLLGRGKHGVSEARNALAAYTEASPLYGLLMYRRRKILIKHIPEGTSRLLQARTAVHFQDVLERYSPYETLLETTSGDALNDTSLAASFHLHTASPSPSMNRLDEIREDEDDSVPGAGPGVGSGSSLASLLSAQRFNSKASWAKRAERAERTRASLSPGKVPQAPAPRTTPPASPDTPSPSPSISEQFPTQEQAATAVTTESPLELGNRVEESATPVPPTSEVADDAVPEPPPVTATDRPTPPTRKPPERPIQPDRTAEPAANEQSEEPASEQPQFPKRRSSLLSQSMEEEPYDFSKYDALFKPKIRLGPRPVNSPDKVKRPAVARVSAVPANFRPSTKRQDPGRPTSSQGQRPNSSQGQRPNSSQGQRPSSSQGQPSTPRATASSSTTETITPTPPPIPDVPEYTVRPLSRGSVKSAPSHRSTAMTADKIRLMKALELRKRQLRKSHGPSVTSLAEEGPLEVSEASQAPRVPERNPMRDRKESLSEIELRPPAELTGTKKEQQQQQQQPDQEQDQVATDDESQHQSSKADSGISLRYGTPDTQRDDAGDEPQETTTTQNQPAEEANTQHPPNDILRSNAASISTIVDEPNDEATVVDTLSCQTPTETPNNFGQGSGETAIVPTILMEDGSRPLTSDGESVPIDSTSDVATEVPAHEANSSNETVDDPNASPKQTDIELAIRRRGLVEPLQVDVTSGNPDDFGSDDDDLLDELHCATVQEAKPISIARSPLATNFPRRRPSAETAASVRSVQIARALTMPLERSLDISDRLVPDAARAVLIGSSPTPPPEKNDGAGHRSVSSGISKRIQALTESSSRETTGSGQSWQVRPLTPDPSPNGFLHQDQRDRRTSRKTPTPTGRPTSFRRLSKNSANHSPVTTPGAENTPVWSVQRDPVTNRNSVTVTARITRPATADGTESEQRQLQRSRVLINHQRENGDLSPINTTPSPESAPAMSPALSTNSSEAPSQQSQSRLGKPKQPSLPGLDDFPPPPTNRVVAHASLGTNDENVALKEGSRTSRFFKRMSTFAGPKKRGGLHPAPSMISLVSNESHSLRLSPSSPNNRLSVATEKSDTPPAVVVGDLNVQFPDSLLWKRRIITIDDSGCLQFTIAQAMEIHKGVAQKKYPLSDFKMPYAPDVDRQELDHSIILEFQDGTALQAACEDAMTQRQVLSILKTYWKAYATRSLILV